MSSDERLNIPRYSEEVMKASAKDILILCLRCYQGHAKYHDVGHVQFHKLIIETKTIYRLIN